MQDKELRRHARMGVELQAEVGAGGDRLVGSVLDLSDKGAFFRPEHGFIDSRFVYQDEPLQRLRTGDRVLFKVEREEETWDSPAVVRWIGGSDDHHSTGLGLRFIGTLSPRTATEVA